MDIVPPAQDAGYSADPSFAQERLYAVEMLRPGRSAYAMGDALRLEGALDVGRARDAITAILARHDVLRSSFRLDGGRLRIFVPDARPADLPVEEIAPGPPDARQAAVGTALSALVLAPFDLARGALARFRLLRLAPDLHVLGIALHHAVADGQSLALFRREFAAFYAGDGDALPALPIQYADFAEWERERAGEPAVRAKASSHWAAALADAPGALDLPGAAPRGGGDPGGEPQAGPSGATVRAVLPAGPVAALLRVARARRATPAMAFLAVLAVLIARWSRADDLVIAMPASKRGRPELAGLMGLLVDVLPLRIRVPAEAGFGTVLDTVRDAVLGALDNSALPFEQIVALARGIARAGEPGSGPFQQILFGFEGQEGDPRPDPMRAGGLRIAPWPDLPEQDAKAALSFAVENAGGTWRVALRYARPLFASRAVERLPDWFAALCDGLSASPDAPVGAVALAPGAEAAALLRTMNATARPLPAGTLATLFEARAAAAPDAPALTASCPAAAVLDYGDLNGRANRLAHHLSARGVAAGESVALAMPAGADFVVAMLALAKLGAAYVPLDPALPAARRAAMLAVAGVRRILAAGQDLPRAVTEGCQVVDVARDRAAIARSPLHDPPPSGDPGSVAYVMFTSGSTGTPKGVAVPQRAVVRLVCGSDFLQIGPADGVGFASSVSFDASTLEIWGALLNGARLCEVPREALFSAPALADLIGREALSVLWVTKGLFDQLAGVEPAAFRGLRVLLTGGDAADAGRFRRVLEACPALVLLNGYGPTENTTFSTVWRARLPIADGPVPIGGPIANSRAYVLDGAGNPLPPGLPGELHVAGLGLALGYVGRDDLTAERFVPDPFGEPGTRMYRTGDLARLDEEGTITFLGRLDDQVKIRGFRIERGEIVAALARHPSVAASHVEAAEDVGSGKRLVAYVVPRAGETVTPAGLRRHLRDSLPDHMVPAGFAILDAMPLTSAGKVDRRALPAPDFAAGREPASSSPPSSASEILLAGVWAEVLSLPSVAREDNFFEVGGDSILCIRVVARARDRGLMLTPNLLFQHQTVAAVAAALDASSGPRNTSLGARATALVGPPRQLLDLLDGPDAEAGASWTAGWLRPRRRVDALTVGFALEELRHRHGALRLRLAGDETGRVLEELDMPPPVPIAALRLCPARAASDRGAPAPDPSGALMRDLAAAIDLRAGVVLRGALVDEGAGRQRIVLLAHKLAADEASVAHLLDELAGLLDGDGPDHPAPQFGTWLERLAATAGDPALGAQMSVWGDPVRHGARFASRGAGGHRTPAGSGRWARQRLSAEAAAALAPPALAARRIAAVEIGLAALAAALGEIEGGRGGTALIDVVVDGRDGWEGLVGNPGRRVPVALSLGDAPAAERLSRAKTALRGMPGGGIGYALLDRDLGPLPRSTIALVDGLAAGPRRCGAAGLDGMVLGRHPAAPGDHAVLRLERDADGLFLACAAGDGAGGAAADPARLAARAAFWIGRLSSEAPGAVLTPSDFPLAQVDAPTLRRLLAGLGGAEVADVYPLSPMQESMLVHALTVADTVVSFEQACHRVEGRLDIAAFHAAWQSALDRHPILRTSFAWDGLARPLQVVHAALRFDFRLDDWSALPVDEQERRRRALLVEDRAEGFRLDRAPLLRARLVRLAGEAFVFVTSYHHILLDGWSLPQLEREVRLAYEAAVSGRALRLSPPRPYSDYIAWLQARGGGGAPAYFESLLEGWAGPVRLPASAPSDGATRGKQNFDEAVRVLDEADTRVLTRFARARRLTPGALLHAGWGLTLMRQTGSRDVVFGTTVSGRPAELAGVEGMVGLFINNLPVRLRVDDAASTGDVLTGLQAQLLTLQQHGSASPLAIEASTAGPPGLRLFDSLVVVENVASSLRVWETSALRFTLLGSPLKTNYGLTLVAVPGERLRLSLVFDAARFAAPAVQGMLDELVRLLPEMANGADRPVADLLPASPPAAAPPEAAHPEAAHPEAAGPAPARAGRPRCEVRLAPRSTAEVRVARIVEAILGVADPGVTDDLLLYGLDSLSVSRLGARLAREFGRTLPLTRIVSHATVAGLAALAAGDAPPWQPLVRLARGDSGRSLHCVHPIAGDVTVFLDLARALTPFCGFVALQAPGLAPGDPDCDGVEEIAAVHAEALLSGEPGPIALGGYSFGGVVAFEIARQMLRRGRPPARVTIIDTPAPLAGRWPAEAAEEGDAAWLWRMLRVRERFHGVDLGLRLRDVERAGDGACGLVAARLVEVGLLPDGADADLLARMARVSRRHYAAYRRYRPEPLAVPLAVIRAARVDDAEAESAGADRFGLADLGWGALAGAGIATATVPGDHVTMMRRPAVDELARTIDRLQGWPA